MTEQYIANWSFIDPRRGVVKRSSTFASEQEARRHCQRMKRAGCLDATFCKT